MIKSNATEANKALALEGIRGLFIDRDPAVVDRLFAADYRQHNPQIPNGPAAIKAVLGKLPADFKYELGLVIADGDYVSIHGRYTGWGRSLWLRSISSVSPMEKLPNIGMSCRKRFLLARALMGTAWS